MLPADGFSLFLGHTEVRSIDTEYTCKSKNNFSLVIRPQLGQYSDLLSISPLSKIKQKKQLWLDNLSFIGVLEESI